MKIDLTLETLDSVLIFLNDGSEILGRIVSDAAHDEDLAIEVKDKNVEAVARSDINRIYPLELPRLYAPTPRAGLGSVNVGYQPGFGTSGGNSNGIPDSQVPCVPVVKKSWCEWHTASKFCCCGCGGNKGTIYY